MHMSHAHASRSHNMLKLVGLPEARLVYSSPGFVFNISELHSFPNTHSLQGEINNNYINPLNSLHCKLLLTIKSKEPHLRYCHGADITILIHSQESIHYWISLRVSELIARNHTCVSVLKHLTKRRRLQS